jgi:AAA15 family ATPase/GTPase
MKITKVRIDGFRNIKDTQLDFSEKPVIILLAPNNYGKSNLLKGIQEGFELIRKQGTAVYKYIKACGYKNRNASDSNVFTFEVEFTKRKNEENRQKTGVELKRYNYSVSIDSTLVSEPKDEIVGVISESLFLTEIHESGEEKFIRLFERIDESESVLRRNTAFLGDRDENGKNKEKNKVSIYGKGKFVMGIDYPPQYYLFLHKLGNMAVLKDTDQEILDALDEIQGVLTSLTREDIGTIIADESSEYRNSFRLATEAQHLEKKEKVKPDETNEFKYFQKCFKDMFGYDFRIIPVGEQHQLLFQKGDNVEETVSDLSFGTRRTFKLLSQVIVNIVPLISLEELENGLHPALYQTVLNSFFESLNRATLEERKNEPRLILTSHAPEIINKLWDYLDTIYIGSPCVEGGYARFLTLSNVGKEILRAEVIEADGEFGDLIFKWFYGDDTSRRTEAYALLEKKEG